MAEEVTVDDILDPDNESYNEETGRLTEKRAALLAEYRLNGGNVTKAAEVVGLNPSYARRVAATDPGFRLLLEATNKAPLTKLVQWGKLTGKAQETLLELMDCEDNRVRFMAAREVLDRAEGKPTQKTEKTETKVTASIDQETMMMALSLVATGVVASLQEAILKARTDPSGVQRWLSNGKDMGREIVQKED